MKFYCNWIQDQRGPFWIVFEGWEPGIYDAWPKPKYQVNGISRSCHKKTSTLYEAVDSTEYCTFKTQLTNREAQQATVAQINTITDEEVEKIADEFTSNKHRKKITKQMFPLFRPRAKSFEQNGLLMVVHSNEWCERHSELVNSVCYVKNQDIRKLIKCGSCSSVCPEYTA